MTVTIALAGNPNVGKSTIFNALTGSHQHTGNWPGKTVEKKEGRLQIGKQEMILVDLPGAYSLTAYSVEEMIARDFIIHERPQAVVTVVDAANLERNLYLVAQIIELEVPVILALNMTDIAMSRGLRIDTQRLSQQLQGIPVVEMVSNRRQGLEPLKRVIQQVVEQSSPVVVHIPYGGILGAEMAGLEAQINGLEPLKQQYQPRWLATKLLENDSALVEALEMQGMTAVLNAAAAAQERIEAATGEDAETLIADQRYTFIGNTVAKVLERPAQAVLTRSDKIDEIVTHRIWGLPIFLLMMWLVFQFTANVSAPFLDWVDSLINGTLYGWAETLLGWLGLGDTWLATLVTGPKRGRGDV